MTCETDTAFQVIYQTHKLLGEVWAEMRADFMEKAIVHVHLLILELGNSWLIREPFTHVGERTFLEEPSRVKDYNAP